MRLSLLGVILGALAAGGLASGCGGGPEGAASGSGERDEPEVAPGAPAPSGSGAGPGAPGGPGAARPGAASPGAIGSGATGDRVEEGGPGAGVALDESAEGAGEPVASGDPAVPASAPSGCVLPAPAAAPVGYGAATTGGGQAPAIVVSSFAEAEAALESYRDDFEDGVRSALVLRYAGSFDFASISDVCEQHTKDAQVLEIKEMENVTLEGAPGSSANFGIKINRARNVIVRNMTLGLLPGGGDSDAITIEGNGTNGDVEHVWIDHNELFSSTKDDCDGAGDTEFDGLIDIKRGARLITISFNYLHDHQKTGLLGHSDSDDMERFVTFHHNRYENVVSRTPLHRFGFIHLFNNYYGQISGSGINVRMGGVALIEQNFFENVANPVTSRFSDEPGFWDLRGNHVGAGISWTTESDTLANAEDWASTAAFPPEQLTYSYTPDAAGCVKQIVLATAGAVL